MVPSTSKTMVRAPVVVSAARSEPTPESFRFVTLMTLPPRPPLAHIPNPSAPGKAGVAGEVSVVKSNG